MECGRLVDFLEVTQQQIGLGLGLGLGRFQRQGGGLDRDRVATIECGLEGIQRGSLALDEQCILQRLVLAQVP